MVPSCNHDFALYSWLTAVTGFAKLAVILDCPCAGFIFMNMDI